MKTGASDGTDETGLSHAFGAIAETGTLMLTSGTDNPTTLNFLPENHIVIVDAAEIKGDLEALMSELRKTYGKGEMPRTVNLVTGPSRSGDIEQKIILGAHGPRALHVIVVGVDVNGSWRLFVLIPTSPHEIEARGRSDFPDGWC